jgi:antitoxin component of MazEF toxin-antitoxin module
VGSNQWRFGLSKGLLRSDTQCITMQDEIVVEAKQWGNSISVILDSELVKKQKINPKDTLLVSVKKVDDIHSLRGTFPKKRSTQEIVEGNKKGW